MRFIFMLGGKLTRDFASCADAPWQLDPWQNATVALILPAHDSGRETLQHPAANRPAAN